LSDFVTYRIHGPRPGLIRWSSAQRPLIKANEMNRIHDSDNSLFCWSNGLVLLLVDRSEDAWVIARGWHEGDGLVDVRRWRFACERRLIGQMRRLVHEATQRPSDGDDVASQFTAWLATASATAQSPNVRLSN
jgi:hypothetical protein